MTDVPHLGFIVAAYGFTALVLGAIVLAVVLDGRMQNRQLAKLGGLRDGFRGQARDLGEGS